MTIDLSVALLLLMAEPAADVAATSTAPGSAQATEMPCRLLGVQVRTGGESFLTCPNMSLRLEPGRNYELIWNATLQQMLVIGRGQQDDRIFLVSNGSGLQPLLEDLTVELISTAEGAEPSRSVQGLRLKDSSQFATDGQLRISGIEYDPPAGKKPLELSMRIAAMSAVDSMPAVLGTSREDQVTQRVTIVR